MEIGRLAEKVDSVSSVSFAEIYQKARPRGLRRRLTPEVRAELVERRKAGETLRVLSKEFDISESGLRDMLAVEGLAIKRTPITPEEIDRAVELYKGGLTVKQVVAEVGYSFGTVRRILRKRGVVMRRNGKRQTN